MATVHILTNESMSDIVKISITDNLSRRLWELDNTSTPPPFECFYAVEANDARAIENLLYKAFDDKRVRMFPSALTRKKQEIAQSKNFD